MRKAFLFDLDDTLIDTINTKIEAIVYTGKTHFQADIDPQVVRKLWGKPFAEVMRAAFPENVPTEDILKKYREERDKFPSPQFPKTVEVLRILTHTAVLGIVTSHTKAYIHDDLVKAEIPPDLFSFIHAAEDTEFHKPDPRVFDNAIEKLALLNVPKEQVTYVGDSLVDYEAARDAKIAYIAIANRTVSRAALDALGVRTITDITGLLRL